MTRIKMQHLHYERYLVEPGSVVHCPKATFCLEFVVEYGRVMCNLFNNTLVTVPNFALQSVNAKSRSLPSASASSSESQQTESAQNLVLLNKNTTSVWIILLTCLRLFDEHYLSDCPSLCPIDPSRFKTFYPIQFTSCRIRTAHLHWLRQLKKWPPQFAYPHSCVPITLLCQLAFGNQWYDVVWI